MPSPPLVDGDNTRRRRGSSKSKPPSLSIDYATVEDTTPGRKERRPRRKRRQRQRETPFHILVLQVGATLFVVCVVLFVFSKWMWPSDEEDGEYYYETTDEETQQEQKEAVIITEAPKETIPPLPVVELGENAKYDAYGLAELYSNKNKDGEEEHFWKVAASIRAEFSHRYGGENAARGILERGLSTFGTSNSDVQHTACRIRDAKQAKRPFSFAFGGYSVTTGRGNFFSQSFPFVMERILQRPFRILDIELQVRNAAVGGIPSFPYGWCMENFWGLNADVVSWDYSMNEAGGVPEGLEAYLRHVLMLNRRPKLVVKDTHMAVARREVLEHYVKIGVAADPVVVHTDPATYPFLNMQEEYRPEGFQQWRKFGAPPGAPGQALHHPAIKEHEFIGWLIAMHFLSALELLVAANQSAEVVLKCDSTSSHDVALPPPFSVNLANTTMDWSSLLFGSPTDDSSTWEMNPVRCRTSYEPVMNGTLDSIVVSGVVGQDLSLSMPKGAMYYTKGWVLDLGDKEKLAKRKLDLFDGLGFLDCKKAYYGIYSSGTLSLFLPYEPQFSNSTLVPKVGDDAREWIPSIVVCEVNEKREGRVCDMEKDVSYVVGGANATGVKKIDSTGTLYYGKKLCVFMKVPVGATVSSRKDDGSLGSDQRTGVSLDMSVSDKHIMKKQMACSVSHVVWEQQEER